MKKFDQLGRSLSKTEQKMIMGGTEFEVDPGDGTAGCSQAGDICGVNTSTGIEYKCCPNEYLTCKQGKCD